MPPAGYRGAVRAFVVKVTWSQLQPTEPAAGDAESIAADNPIDQALAQVQQLNAENPNDQMRLKIRVEGGISAPQWLKTLDGFRPIPIRDSTPQPPVSGTVGPFWTSQYLWYYDAFEQGLAARYDSEPDILEVDSPLCMTVFNEPLLRQANDQQNVHAYQAAGYTYQADERCQYEQIQVLKSAWKQTRVVLAFNPYQRIEPNGKVLSDEGFTQQLMGYFRHTMGEQGVIENDSIRSRGQNSSYNTMYEGIRSFAAPITYQTATLKKVGDLESTLEWAVSQGANAVELPAGYTQVLSAAKLQTYSSELDANPTD